MLSVPHSVFVLKSSDTSPRGNIAETFRGETQFVLLSYYIVDLYFPSRPSNIINNCLASRKLLIGSISTAQAKCQANYSVLFSYV